MGAGQSKTETVYSRYEKENELLPNLKITPSVIERLNQAQNPASGPSYEAIEEEKQRLQEKLKIELFSIMKGTPVINHEVFKKSVIF